MYRDGSKCNYWHYPGGVPSSISSKQTTTHKSSGGAHINFLMPLDMRIITPLLLLLFVSPLSSLVERDVCDRDEMATPRLPTLFAAHGGGPMPVLGDKAHASLSQHLRTWTSTLKQTPKAVLVVSAHWEVRWR